MSRDSVPLGHVLVVLRGTCDCRGDGTRRTSGGDEELHKENTAVTSQCDGGCIFHVTWTKDINLKLASIVV